MHLEGAHLEKAHLEETDLRKVDLNASTWFESDIQRALPELKMANFTHLIIRADNGTKKVERRELFPSEN